MQNLQQSLRKLSDLKSNGVINDKEYEARRKQLVDNYVGISSNQEGPTYSASSTAYDASLVGNQGLGFYGIPPARMAMYAPVGYPAGYMAPIPLMPYFKGPKPASRAGSSTIKVQPLPTGLTKEALVLAFTTFGEVASAVVKRGSPTYGYVNFTQPQAAAAALAQGQVTIAGTVAQISLGKKRKAAAQEAGPSNGVGLFNLPFSTTHDELHYMLKDYDGFQRIKMVQRKDNGQFKGYAFAYFDTVENAIKAKGMLAGLTVGDQHVDVKFASQAAEDALPPTP